MLKKVCDNCGKEMKLDNNNYYYEENTFSLSITNSNNEEIMFSGDLCEKCEKDIIEGITKTLNNYHIKEEEEEEENDGQNGKRDI